LYDKQTEQPSLVDYLQSIAASDTDAFDPAAGKGLADDAARGQGLEFECVYGGSWKRILPHERCLQSKRGNGGGTAVMLCGRDACQDELTLTLASAARCEDNFADDPVAVSVRDGIYHPRDIDTVQTGMITRTSPMMTLVRLPRPQKQPRFRMNELVQHSTFGLGRVRIRRSGRGQHRL
jgi:hypothetical protein